MALPAVLLAKLAAAVVSNEGMRRKAGWIVAAILSPFIVTLTLFCSLLSGGAEHNRSAVLLSFHGGDIPRQTPAEYAAYIDDMRRSFALLDDAIAAVHEVEIVGILIFDQVRSASPHPIGRIGDCIVEKLPVYQIPAVIDGQRWKGAVGTC